jgi:5-methyltetrahydrofolate--homocysteine methyltransferase
MPDLLNILKGGKILVSDGAMGTMLFQKGLNPGDCPEKMNLEYPRIVEEIALAYIEAGAEIIQTNTFGGSTTKLNTYGLGETTEEINAAAVRIAKKAAGGKVFVAASCGPSGRILKPYGDAEPSEILDGFERQMTGISSVGVDLIAIETMIDLSEAKLALQAAKKIAPDTAVAVSMTFDLTPRGFFTIMGTSVKQAVEELTDAGADILGSNCGNGSENMIAITAEFRKYANLPIQIRPNAGLPRLENGILLYPETPEFMAEKSIEFIRKGANIIGGCCGSTPAHIALIKKKIIEFSRPK